MLASVEDARDVKESLHSSTSPFPLNLWSEARHHNQRPSASVLDAISQLQKSRPAVVSPRPLPWKSPKTDPLRESSVLGCLDYVLRAAPSSTSLSDDRDFLTALAWMQELAGPEIRAQVNTQFDAAFARSPEFYRTDDPEMDESSLEVELRVALLEEGGAATRGFNPVVTHESADGVWRHLLEFVNSTAAKSSPSSGGAQPSQALEMLGSERGVRSFCQDIVDVRQSLRPTGSSSSSGRSTKRQRARVIDKGAVHEETCKTQHKFPTDVHLAHFRQVARVAATLEETTRSRGVPTKVAEPSPPPLQRRRHSAYHSPTPSTQAKRRLSFVWSDQTEPCPESGRFAPALCPGLAFTFSVDRLRQGSGGQGVSGLAFELEATFDMRDPRCAFALGHRADVRERVKQTFYEQALVLLAWMHCMFPV